MKEIQTAYENGTDFSIYMDKDGLIHAGSGVDQITWMDVRVGDRLQMKKAHPCGSHLFSVLRIGADFKIRCTGCGREVMLPRAKIEKNIKKIIRPGEE